MGKRLTKNQLENRNIENILLRIKTIEKRYGVNFTKRACSRYSLQKGAEHKLVKEIQQREKELAQLKRKVNR
jgi:hypothetical protein